MKKTMIFMLLCAAMATAFTACEKNPANDDPAGQEGNNGNDNDNPGGTVDDGKTRVRQIVQGGEEYGMVYKFEYDGDNLVKFTVTDNANQADHTYDISYGNNTIEVVSSRQYWEDEDIYAVRYNFTTDGNGMVTGGTEEWISGDEGSGRFSLSYEGGFLAGIQYDGDYRDESNAFTWTDGQLTGNVFSSESPYDGLQETEYTYIYSNSPNNANIDLNWFSSASYNAAGTQPEWLDWSLAIAGMTGHLGEKSSCLIANAQTPEYEYTADDYDNMAFPKDPIPEDGIYKVPMEVPFYKVEGGQYTLNDEGLPITFTSTTKVYRVTFEWSVRKTITDYENFDQPDGPDGQKLYYSYDEEVLGIEEISREAMTEYPSSMTISY